MSDDNVIEGVVTDTPNIFSDADTIDEVVFQAVGAGSVCWESLAMTGVFQDQKAAFAAQEAVTRIRQILTEAME